MLGALKQEENEKDKIVLHSTDLESLLSHIIGNTMNELIFGLTYEKTDKVWNRIQYLREEGIKVQIIDIFFNIANGFCLYYVKLFILCILFHFRSYLCVLDL